MKEHRNAVTAVFRKSTDGMSDQIQKSTNLSKRQVLCCIYQNKRL